jgi:hypothetical protein
MFVEEYNNILLSLECENYDIEGFEIIESALTEKSSFSEGRCCNLPYFSMKLSSLINYINMLNKSCSSNNVSPERFLTS